MKFTVHSIYVPNSILHVTSVRAHCPLSSVSPLPLFSCSPPADLGIIWRRKPNPLLLSLSLSLSSRGNAERESQRTKQKLHLELEQDADVGIGVGDDSLNFSSNASNNTLESFYSALDIPSSP